MSEVFSEQITAVANVVLAVFAIVTAVLAGLAFRKQSREVSDQGEMLELQRQQLEAQREDSTKQAGVLELQAAELRESLEERKQDAEEKRRSQAALVAVWFAFGEVPFRPGVRKAWGATVRNSSDLPVFDVSVFFHSVEEPVRGAGWVPVPAGSAAEKLRVLPPLSERHVLIPPDLAKQREECNADVYVASIWFTDAAGNRWERDPRGALKPLSTRAPRTRAP